MKKFLTVLLALSVVFTYTVGTAFAADPVVTPTPTTHSEAMAQAESKVVKELTDAADAAKKALAAEYKEKRISEDCVISGSVYSATIDKMVADYKNIIKDAAMQVDKANANETDADTLAGAIKTATVTQSGIVYKNVEQTVVVGTLLSNGFGFLTTGKGTTDVENYYVIYSWNTALDSMKEYVNGEINKIDLTLYTDDVATPEDAYKTTWAQKAAKAKQDKLDVVTNTSIDATKARSVAEKALASMYDVLDDLIPVKTVEAIDGTKTVITYKLPTTIKTADDLKDASAVTEAEKATLRAQVKTDVADYYKWALNEYNKVMNDPTKSDADKAAAKDTFTSRQNANAAYEEVNITLIDAEKITKSSQFVDAWEAARRVDSYEKAEDLAAVLKLQVEKEGSAKYDAAKIDEILAKLKVRIYNGGAAATEADFKDALITTDSLAWDKEVAVAAVTADMNSTLYGACGADKYYAPEKEKVQAKYQEKIDKINAAADAKQLAAAKALPVNLTGIKDKAAVKSSIETFLNTGKFVNAVNSYLDYLNIGIATYADGYREDVTAADVAPYLAEAGVRTNTEVAAYFDKAEEYAKSVKTLGEKKEAKTAVETLVKAIPNYVTLADKPAIKAAWEAADEIGYTSTKLTNAVNFVKGLEEKAIDDMIKALPAKLTAADLDAVNAIYDAIDVYTSERMYGCPDYDTTAVDKAYEAVRNAALADVQNAIASLPADATKAQVEAARAAVDAFVETYTDASEPYWAINKIVNLDKLTYAEAQVKAKEIKAVEALKLTASSTAKKGSITVKWKVKGDASAVTYYEVRKSTKKNSGFGTKPYFKTTKKTYKNTKELKKGTRYYYKVRAVAEIDGVKYTSDWSNKAYRIAK